MDIKPLAIVFVTVFLAELGDKTQLATLLFAANGNRLGVFLAASLALTLSTLIAVTAGALVSQWLNPRYLAIGSGALFIVIGVATISLAVRS